MERETSAQLHYRSSFTQNTNSPMIPKHASFSSTSPRNLKPPPDHQKEEDPEISIFDAQKYFNEINPHLTIISSSFSPPKNSHQTIIPRRLSSCSSSSVADGYNNIRNYKVQSTTPTASSEASWNSQTGLLSKPPGALPVSLTNLPINHRHLKWDKRKGGRRETSSSNSRVAAGGTKWFFGHKYPCFGKKSVQVQTKEIVPPALYTKSQSNPHNLLPHSQYQNQDLIPNDHLRVSSSLSSSSHHNYFSSNSFNPHRQHHLSGSELVGFSFPTLNNPPQQLSTNLFDDPPRDSLEVFQPMEEQPAVSVKAGGRVFGFIKNPVYRDNDVASNASSELFEIESFSTQTTSYPMHLRRVSFDEAQNFHASQTLSTSNFYDEPMTPSIAATECYEPSEASIDWSVTTAEGFERASLTNFSISAASEIHDVAITRHAGVNNGGGGRRKGNGVGLLMSCRHEKAVTIGPPPVECVAATAGEGQYGGGRRGGPPAAVLPLISTSRHVSSGGPKCKFAFYAG